MHSTRPSPLAPPAPPPPAPRSVTHRRRGLLLLALLTLLLSSCTFHNGKQMEVDFMGVKYRFYIYEKPSAQIAVELRNYCRSTDGIRRQQWAQCSLKVLRAVHVSTLAKHDWEVFTRSDQWDDYGGAVEDVVRGGLAKDRKHQRYAWHCLVGDHTGFRAYNWTTRVARDAHCQIGENA